MEFSEIEKIVLGIHKFPEQADKDELFALFALKGLLDYFHAGNVNKLAASNHKKRIAGWLEMTKCPKTTDAEKEWNRRTTEVAELQSKILLANLLHANPYTLLMQACKAVSILLDDQMHFYNQVHKDCHEIIGMGLDDPLPLEAEREQLEQDIALLETKINESKDAERNYRLNLAKETMQTRLDAIAPPEKKKNLFE